MTKLEQAARQALGALEVATTPMAKDRQEVLSAITTLREALSGVQALSAAPAIGDELRDTLVAVSAAIAERDDRAAQKMICEILAASTTTPAEQQATKETSGGLHVWRDISTAPKDGSIFVATGHNYGLYSEVRHTCVAQWFQGCWMEASDWNETSELKYLTHWMPLPSPPDDVAAPAEQQAQPGAVYAELPQPDSWFHFTAQFWENKLRDFADRTHALRMQAAPKAAPGEPSDTSFSQFLSDVMTAAGLVSHGKQCKALGDRLADMVMRLRTAPQQEAQEPCGWPEDRVRIEKTEKNGWCAYLDIGNKHRVRIGTIILCRGINSENEARALAQNWMRDFVPNPKQVAAPQQEAQEPGEIDRLRAALVYTAFALHDKPQYMLADGIALIDGDTVQVSRDGWKVQASINPLRQSAQPAPQPAPAPLSDDVVRDAARWRWLSEHIGVAWNEGKFTSLVRIVSDKNRAALNASIDRMMTGDWSDAALAAQERQP